MPPTPLNFESSCGLNSILNSLLTENVYGICMYLPHKGYEQIHAKYLQTQIHKQCGPQRESENSVRPKPAALRDHSGMLPW